MLWLFSNPTGAGLGGIRELPRGGIAGIEVLFEELVDADGSTDERYAARARRLISAELNDRAARLGPSAA